MNVPEDMDHPLERKVRELERRLVAVERTDRLIASSIDAGGLTVKGGFIRWLDDEGVETARFATDGLTLEGLLKVIGNVQVAGDDGKIEILDANGDVALTLGTEEMTLSGVLKMLAGANIETYDENGDLRAELGNVIRFTDPAIGEVVTSLGELASGNYGLHISGAGDVDLGVHRKGYFLATYADGTTAILVSDNPIDEVLLEYPDGTFAQRISDDRWAVAYPDIGGAGTAVEVDDELAISGPGTRGVVIRVTEADGIRMAVDTAGAGVQSGQVTAGPADSAGTGFRTLRIPN